MVLFLLGSVVNSVAILVGVTVGLMVPRLSEQTKTTIMQGLSLAVVLIGLSMALSDDNDILVIILAMVTGGLLGEWAKLEARLDSLGEWIEKKTHKRGNGQVAEAFVTASLVFCVGAMAIVGGIQSGLSDNHGTLFAKSLLDLVSAIIFTTTLGFGVALSAIPVFLYEGGIATLSHFAGAILQNQPVIAVMTATGGLLIVGIGITLLSLQRIHVGNLLPAMFVAPLLKWGIIVLSHYIHLP